MSPHRITCLHVTETALTCSGLPEQPKPIADAILGWLHDHGLNEELILANRPIVRDPEKHTIRWTAVNPNGGPAYDVVEQPPLGAPAEWPAPFPPILLDQVQPPACSACGRAFDPDAEDL